MEISKQFAESQYQLHKTEADKWSKIIKTFDSSVKKRVSKKEQELLISNQIDAYHNKIRKRNKN